MILCVYFVFFFSFCSLAQKRVRETKKTYCDKRDTNMDDKDDDNSNDDDQYDDMVFPSFSILQALVYISVCVYVFMCILFLTFSFTYYLLMIVVVG